MLSKLKVFIIILLLMSFVLFLQQWAIPTFAVDEIECYVGQDSCPSELLDQLIPLQNRSLFFSKFDQQIQTFNLQTYQLDSIQKRLPSTLIVRLKPEASSYQLYLPNQESPLIIAENGIMTLANPNSQLPTVFVTDWTTPVTNDQVDPELHQLIRNLTNSLETHHLDYTSITIVSPEVIQVELRSGMRVLFHQDQLETQVLKLAIVVQELQQRLTELAIVEIDVRFDLPILRTAYSH